MITQSANPDGSTAVVMAKYHFVLVDITSLKQGEHIPLDAPVGYRLHSFQMRESNLIGGKILLVCVFERTTIARTMPADLDTQGEAD